MKTPVITSGMEVSLDHIHYQTIIPVGDFLYIWKPSAESGVCGNFAAPDSASRNPSYGQYRYRSFIL
jgi:hypothetical protein